MAETRTPNPPDLGAAGEQAATELANRLRRIIPPSLLADPDAFARRYWTDAITRGWRHHPPAVAPVTPGHADPPNDEWKRARAALEKTTPP